mmetsp:Transcript_8479/g.25661  ORF Transcript_8479/g.25661 Transcript_8479/m.25661 type:complete len:226 (+) Transcript_8479:2360-3037(+)
MPRQLHNVAIVYDRHVEHVAGEVRDRKVGHSQPGVLPLGLGRDVHLPREEQLRAGPRRRAPRRAHPCALELNALAAGAAAHGQRLQDARLAERRRRSPCAKCPSLCHLPEDCRQMLPHDDRDAHPLQVLTQPLPSLHQHAGAVGPCAPREQRLEKLRGRQRRSRLHAVSVGSHGRRRGGRRGVQRRAKRPRRGVQLCLPDGALTQVGSLRPTRGGAGAVALEGRG